MRREISAVLAALALASALPALSCSGRPELSVDFETPDSLESVEWGCRTLCRLAPEHAASGRWSLEVSFFPAPPWESESYPGVTFHAFDPDWTRRRALLFDAYNPEAGEQVLTLRVDDRKDPPYADRVNRRVALAPGANRIAVPLAGLTTSGSGRSLDLAGIRRVSLFRANPGERHSVYLDRLRLE